MDDRHPGVPAPLDGVHDLHLTLHGDFRLAAFRLASPQAVAD
ncbi:hypothetical protein [Streptomyces sp. Ru72]|nr:hypothetical protein [Streptomyces sp. Ru72]